MYITEIGPDIEKAAYHLKKNELVAIPTETVYGLAANACSPGAIRKVFEVKNRPSHNPLIVHVPEIAAIRDYVTRIPEPALALLEAFSPGPLTVLLPGNGVLPSEVNKGGRLIAFRIPAHGKALALLQSLSFPLVAPSANMFTTISPTTSQHVYKNFEGKIPYILEGGACNVGVESTVVGFDDNDQPVIYRQGGITMEEIEMVTGRIVMTGKKEAAASPGTMLHHYAPRTPFYLVENLASALLLRDPERTGALCYGHHYAFIPRKNQFVLSAAGDLQEAAQRLYMGLHYLDELGLDAIIAQKLPNIGLGIAINDRLQKAAHLYQYENREDTIST